MRYYVQRPYIQQNSDFHTEKVFRYTVQCLLALGFRAFSESLYPAITTSLTSFHNCQQFSGVVMSQPQRGCDGIAISLNWQLSLND